jgi:aminoglycoside phosphotransferase family enzyme
MNRAVGLERAPDLAAKIAALHEPTTYPEHPAVIEAVETHMSYVLLTPEYAYKLKKPVRYDYLDFSTPEARAHNCREELALNRALAPGVYLGVVPLTADARGRLALGGMGEPVEWLVQMRRLPAERMLDRRLRDRSATTGEIRGLAEVLARFYRDAPAALTDGDAYRMDYARKLEANSAVLADPCFRLPADLALGVHARLARFLERAGNALARRAAEGRVVEGHGDLRPEHVCLVTPPVVFDRLEFNRAFRLVDAADELASLSMECERLGAPIVGVELFERYGETAGDCPPDELLHFYAAYRACLRARLAILHTKELAPAAWPRWQALAADYLRLARRHTAWIQI